MGTRQTKNNSKQDVQKGKSVNDGKSARRKQGTPVSTAASGRNEVVRKLRK